jgi:hypothetical protein
MKEPSPISYDDVWEHMDWERGEKTPPPPTPEDELRRILVNSIRTYEAQQTRGQIVEEVALIRTVDGKLRDVALALADLAPLVVENARRLSALLADAKRVDEEPKP